MRYEMIIEPGERNYSAYLLTCLVVSQQAKRLTKLRKNMAEAIALHLQGLREGLPISLPTSLADYVEAA